ncbi:MAG TPA: hypothetical protein VIR63_05140, partial [Pontiella sp.]
PLSAGVLLVGGGSFLNGAHDLGQKIFNVPCKRAKPYNVQGTAMATKNRPLYASLIGAVRYAASVQKSVEKPSIWKKFMKLVWGGDYE